MALTVLDLKEGKKTGGWPEAVKVHFAELSLDATYTAGGYALTASDYEMASILGVVVLGTNGASVGILPQWDKAASKLIIYKGAGSTTVTTGSGGFTELATNDTYASTSVKVQVLIIGTGN